MNRIFEKRLPSGKKKKKKKKRRSEVQKTEKSTFKAGGLNGGLLSLLKKRNFT